jgi:translation initiation factor 2B subunit (eIF-2B alpha/beta/delta family)
MGSCDDSRTDAATCSLRSVLNAANNGVYRERFSEVEALAKSLPTRSDLTPLPYCVPRGTSHCERIERYLNNIIWGARRLRDDDFEPTPEEALYLLSATWLHDMGMMHGLLDSDDKETLRDYDALTQMVREHDLRIVKYIHEKWRSRCSWSDSEKRQLTKICAYHRRHRPLGTFEPARIDSEYDGKPVRLAVLAALLRLADACDEARLRPPRLLVSLFRAQGIPNAVGQYWQTANLIVAVDVDVAAREIILKTRCPKELGFHLGILDLQEIVDMVQDELDEELQSVQQVLLPYDNLNFNGVVQVPSSPVVVTGDEHKQFLSVWPYLLRKGSSPTEFAAALAQMLLIGAREAGQPHGEGEEWLRNVVSEMLDATRESRSDDCMVTNLRRGVRSLLSGSKPYDSAESLIPYLEEFLNSIERNLRAIAQHIDAVVAPNDVLVVHGYCADIAYPLRQLGGKGGHRVYVIGGSESANSIREECEWPSEDERMLLLASELGFEQVALIPLSAVAKVLDGLRREGASCRVLLSTHAVVEGRDFICKSGSRMLALAADAARRDSLDVKVIVFAEQMKFLPCEETNEHVKTEEESPLPKDWATHPVVTGATYLRTSTDLLSRDSIDLVVTESAVFESNELVTGEGVLTTDRLTPIHANPRQPRDYGTTTMGPTSRLAEAFGGWAEGIPRSGDEDRRESPHASEDFDKLFRNAKGLRNSIGDASQVLFYAKEMERLLGHIEEEARATSRKYEARLAASLRDICQIHDPSKLSEEQAECLKICVTALVEAWGTLTREKLNSLRTRLLEKGLTWLPVTDKAIADLTEPEAQDQV